MNKLPPSVHNLVNCYELEKSELKILYGPMYMNLDYYPPYSEAVLVILKHE